MPHSLFALVGEEPGLAAICGEPAAPSAPTQPGPGAGASGNLCTWLEGS